MALLLAETDSFDAEPKGGMMDVERADDVGLIGHGGSGDVRIMNCGEMDDRVGADRRFHDLAEILNVANKIFDGASLRPGHAVEHGDFMRCAIEQFAHDPLTDLADPAGDENLHFADSLAP